MRALRNSLSSLGEHTRASLFFIPMAAVLVAILAGQLGVNIDSQLDDWAIRVPLVLTSTVESARVVLSNVASATITFAGVAFSISLLVIQLGSGQYSPRVVHTLFRDQFNKLVMGLVVATFTYCLIVLRSVRTALEQNGEPVIPNLSVAVAVVLGIATILAIVAFIDHSAHSMDISEILAREPRRAPPDPRRVVAGGDPHAPAPPRLPQTDRPGTRCASSARAGCARSI
ncbi:MAG TPA: DUF2254 family protein [Euzebya sp.]|nr:DUF2254 family protein [Euzebya sp.]